MLGEQGYAGTPTELWREETLHHREGAAHHSLLASAAVLRHQQQDGGDGVRGRPGEIQCVHLGRSGAAPVCRCAALKTQAEGEVYCKQTGTSRWASEGHTAEYIISSVFM